MVGLKNKVALVTGGTSGIGKVTALALAAHGVHVVLTGRRAAEGNAAAAEAIRAGAAHGAKALFVQGDITDEAHIEKAVAAAVGIQGKLDFAFNNAGVEISGVPTVDATPADYRRVFDINVLGVLLSMKHEIRAMRAGGGGSIVNNCSVAGSIGAAGMGIYMASKHAVHGLTKSAALEVATENIRINSVSPAVIETPMADRLLGHGDADRVAYMLGRHPVGRFGKPEEIAAPVLFLFSNGASFMTGTDIAVDGGLLA